MPKSKFAILAISAALLIGLLYLTYLSFTVTASGLFELPTLRLELSTKT